MFGSHGSGGPIVRNPPPNGRPFRRKRIPGGPRSAGGRRQTARGGRPPAVHPARCSREVPLTRCQTPR